MTPRGSFRLLYLYDVAEEIRLEQLRSRLALATRPAALRHQAPQYVRFAEPPVVQPVPAIELPSGERFEARLSYYDYGVVSLELELPFQLEWNALVALAARWVASTDIDPLALAAVQKATAEGRSYFVKPYAEWLSEDYCIVHVHQEPGVAAADLIAQHGHDIARIIRGEPSAFAPEEQAEVLQARISYYPNDVLVAGWSAAFVYDSPEGASSAIELLKYANTQLLEFRHYDELLSRILADVYKKLETRRGPLMRWRLFREADKLNTVLLDIRELTERTDNAIKFLSDMFDARLYRLAAGRVGVPDYRRLVDDKLHTAGDLYHFMVDQFQHARAFFLELTVVIILLIELYYFFQGKH